MGYLLCKPSLVIIADPVIVLIISTEGGLRTEFNTMFQTLCLFHSLSDADMATYTSTQCWLKQQSTSMPSEIAPIEGGFIGSVN